MLMKPQSVMALDGDDRTELSKDRTTELCIRRVSTTFVTSYKVLKRERKSCLNHSTNNTA